MITYSEYFDDYVEDLNRYLHKIKHSIYNITNKEDYNKTREYIFEAEKCIKQINIEINSLPKGSNKIINQINTYNLDLKKYKNIVQKMSADYYSEEYLNSRQYDMTKKYKEGVDFLKESERRAQDIEDIGYTIMSELNSQRSAILRTKHHTDETRQEQNRVKRMLLSIYQNKLVFKGLLILIIILLVIANIGVIIYKIR
ncbi:vesicle transport v-SNARE protein, putative [Plasmodium reichenowi]|uniref:Vesicle transport v-SNARE protein, putative n=6 Tax=Plasmodium (Laverania) TaxID=418107 RepID=A0A143ZX23_PLAF7|nr:vesicle transport v-SNARE protein, putative [Plasmodium falciparum 3D7]PKC45336.1 vesicle transport v-SNARE protein [Plasmodium falciparum NF54]CDO62565.1 vesicle transport v-SNARE protein, putative [Plasmodium reichenowi]SOS76547.1 vesicle transport v-SNARE protein, putative [Plasmodium sp. gorilla clade G1]CZT62490.1 vesicle transport v-SNARE protein, putative [Plasmodium falciparum 3D7]SOV75904.1 vesicle transport v-SNARE protein, putative [Plasmodium reichenowi]|eukprot:XP_002808624.2 vesicle transport v-SNARE protein, putative [Plasmodium falciparum 3D7]